MALEITAIKCVSDALTEAFGRLMPQLSEHLCALSARELQAVVGSDHAALFAAWDEDRIVGVLTLVWYDVPSGRKAWIEDVVVDASQRGRGVGEMLVRTAVEHARKIGAARVSLTSSPQRTAAHALYRKVGFEEYGTSVFVLKTK